MTNYYIRENGAEVKIKDKEYALEWVKQFLDKANEPDNLSIQVADF